MEFKVKEGQYILHPTNKLAEMAQNNSFTMFIDFQKEIIDNYFSYDKYTFMKKINSLCNFFIHTYLNGDASAFKLLVGYEIDYKRMNEQEYNNLVRDFKIACDKREEGEYKFFLLLDLLPYSNKRADAIIINNDLELSLYDYSVGQIAAKLKNFNGEVNDLPNSQRKQYLRKQKQQKRIESYEGKINMTDETLTNIQVNNNLNGVTYYISMPVASQFELAYKIFMDNPQERVFIPNSICFILPKEYDNSIFVSFALLPFIDNPFFEWQGKKVNAEIIDHVYKHQPKIGMSLLYFRIYFSMFTNLEVVTKKQIINTKLVQHLVIDEDKKPKGVYIRDQRTNQETLLSYGLLFKHMFMFFSLDSWTEYLSYACNASSRNVLTNQKQFFLNAVKRDSQPEDKGFRCLFLNNSHQIDD